ncbi:MAG: carbonic anhydrase, partial [Xanthomonadaceae bacterium]|nr:carbonic anhydrase [Xanthomonadaceae bacterium]
MTILSEILDFNKEFVDAKEYGELRTDKYPSRE